MVSKNREMVDLNQSDMGVRLQPALLSFLRIGRKWAEFIKTVG